VLAAARLPAHKPKGQVSQPWLRLQRPGMRGRQYAGLFHEAHGAAAEAEAAIIAAMKTPYALQSGDYMAAVASVHCLRRGWGRR